jgi:hypothetical protein
MQFSYGQAYRDGAAVSAADLAGTIMEEESAGSALRKPVAIEDLAVLEAERTTNRMTIAWRTAVPADSKVEFAPSNPPYSMQAYDPEPVTMHRLTVTGLLAHTLYHLRASSTPTNNNLRTGVSRDIVAVTRPMGGNLLANPSFEQGTGPSPRAIPGWTTGGSLQIKAADGNWFGSLKPTNGAWLCQGAMNGSDSDGYVYQRVNGVTPGEDYTFSAWVMTAPQENGTWKYDVWNDPNRLIHMRLGIDPSGGTNIQGTQLQWTPRMYSHRRYSQLAKRVIAQSTNLTVFVSMKGTISEWHLYAVDDCALTHEYAPARLAVMGILTNNRVQMSLTGPASRTFRIEASTDLQAWSPIASYFSDNGSIQFAIPAVTNYQHRFFRARRLP